MVAQQSSISSVRPPSIAQAVCGRSEGTGRASGTVSSSVALIRPPNIVTATGWRISLPGAAGSISSGTSATPAARARHQHRRQALQAAPHHKLATERHSFVQRQIDVVADLEDAVARRDAGQA